MSKWPIGVFASIDAGLGVQVGGRQGPARTDDSTACTGKATRTEEHAARFLDRLDELGIRLTAVFGGFDGRKLRGHPHHAAHRGPRTDRDSRGASRRK